jgi:hypothetical protein
MHQRQKRAQRKDINSQHSASTTLPSKSQFDKQLHRNWRKGSARRDTSWKRIVENMTREDDSYTHNKGNRKWKSKQCRNQWILTDNVDYVNHNDPNHTWHRHIDLPGTPSTSCIITLLSMTHPKATPMTTMYHGTNNGKKSSHLKKTTNYLHSRNTAWIQPHLDTELQTQLTGYTSIIKSCKHTQPNIRSQLTWTTQPRMTPKITSTHQCHGQTSTGQHHQNN